MRIVGNFKGLHFLFCLFFGFSQSSSLDKEGFFDVVDKFVSFVFCRLLHTQFSVSSLFFCHLHCETTPHIFEILWIIHYYIPLFSFFVSQHSLEFLAIVEQLHYYLPIYYYRLVWWLILVWFIIIIIYFLAIVLLYDAFLGRFLYSHQFADLLSFWFHYNYGMDLI